MACASLSRATMPDAAEKLMPFSWGSHILKGWQLAEEGIPTGKGRPGLPPQGWLPGLPELFGFTSAKRAQYQQARDYVYKETTRENDDRSAAIRAMVDDSSYRFTQLSKWNAAHPDNPIRGTDIAKEIKSRTQARGVWVQDDKED